MTSAASRDLLCKELGQFTAKVVTDPLSELLSGQKPSRFDNRSLAVDPLWLNSVEPGALDGQPARDDAYTTFASASLLQHRLIVLRSQVLTCLLTCQEALSQMSTSTHLPSAWTCSHSHSRKSVVTWLTGRPDTKRRNM